MIRKTIVWFGIKLYGLIRKLYGLERNCMVSNHESYGLGRAWGRSVCNEPERLLCPVRALGLYIVKSADRAQDDPLEKLFVHFNPDTQLFTTHFRRWVAETIRLTYENSSESDLPKIKAHDVRGISASIAFYRNTPLKDICGLIGWKSSNVFIRHYLRDMVADTELQDIPLVAARTAFP